MNTEKTKKAQDFNILVQSGVRRAHAERAATFHRFLSGLWRRHKPGSDLSIG